ncbi:MAG: hypothetical protein HeimC3_05980 [Candidatus Heimdallarchaeota archaeon LC_3]|nr:MAG: hypothetical protein HeimC3_05980 [Candidatus Heimdallarchaeota archaeon LC_3]
MVYLILMLAQPKKQQFMIKHPRIVEPSPRWVRAKFGSIYIADSKKALLLIAYDREFRTRYYFPKEDVKTEFFEESDYKGRDGKNKYWHIRNGDKYEKNAAYTVVDPPEDVQGIKDYIGFKWNQIDAWFEEEEEIFIHPRDPYKRIDTIKSSRHIKVVIDKQIVAETNNPTLLFETGLPVRYYIPKEDVKTEFLIDSILQTGCPYKGTASYNSVKIGDNIYKNIVWYYKDPFYETGHIKDLISFYNEKVDIYVDGELISKPQTPFS